MTNMRPAAAGAWVAKRLVGRIGLGRLLGCRLRQIQALAYHGDGLGTVAAGEQAIVANAVEALGQDVDEEAADELAEVERHRGVPARSLDPVVLDLEGDTPLVERDQATVRDGDTVCVARQIGEHGL